MTELHLGGHRIRLINGGNYIASSGFPTSPGPYGTVKYNRHIRITVSDL
jgi:hypothetical protein